MVAALAGCSAEKPSDTSDPKASAKWIAYCQKKAGKAKIPQERSHWLQEAYEHAQAMGDPLPGDVAKIPDLTCSISVMTEDLGTFKWSVAQGAQPGTHYNELVEIWDNGAEWRDITLDRHAKALPVFMDRAIDKYDTRFFTQHAEAFTATGFKVHSPLEKNAFNVKYCRFVADQIDDALQQNDAGKIEFLLDQMPRRTSVAVIDRQTEAYLRDAGDFVYGQQTNETLACKLVALGYDCNKIDLAALPFGPAFTEALRADPAYAVRALHLDEWMGPMSKTEAELLLTLPTDAWDALHKLHIEEAIERCLEIGESEAALQFVELRSARNPLNQGAYTELLNLALQYGDKPMIDFVFKNSGEVNIYNIDIGKLANNQELFETFAPKILANIYQTMDVHPRKDGTTLGRIKQAFASKNEKAGLFLVQKYNLSKAWVGVTEGQTLLMDVCEAGNLEAARYLIEQRGEEIHATTGYSELQITIFGSSRPTEGKLTPIFFAAKGGNSQLIKYLRSRGADINARSNFGTTPLMHAVSANHFDAAKTLIALKAHVNAQMNPSINQIDLREIGNYDEIATAYRRAKTNGNQAILDVLIEAGARP